jgi:predicted regulator of Ras-like GTPase activity (Roadblock/LC7/MglB family)
MPTIEETLRSLRDVKGVEGSFVIAESGALVARDLPAIFDYELFADLGPRIARLYEAFLSGGDQMDACLIRYTEHKLYLRRMTYGLIGVLSTAAVNMPALRMVANLVIRRIDPEVARASLAPAPIAAGARMPMPSAAATVVRASSDPRASAVEPTAPRRPPVVPQDGRDSGPPTSDRHVRMYRGRRVDE